MTLAEEKRSELEMIIYGHFSFLTSKFIAGPVLHSHYFAGGVESRSAEKKLEDSKLCLRDLEGQAVQMKAKVKDFELAREKLQREVSLLREEEILAKVDYL
jgi:hypothetical protein